MAGNAKPRHRTPPPWLLPVCSLGAPWALSGRFLTDNCLGTNAKRPEIFTGLDQTRIK